MARLKYTGPSTRPFTVGTSALFMLIMGEQALTSEIDNSLLVSTVIATVAFLWSTLVMGIYLSPTHVVTVGYGSIRRCARHRVVDIYTVSVGPTTDQGSGRFRIDQILFTVADATALGSSGTYVLPGRSHFVLRELRAAILPAGSPEPIRAVVIADSPMSPAPVRLIAGTGVIGGMNPTQFGKVWWSTGTPTGRDARVPEWAYSDVLGRLGRDRAAGRVHEIPEADTATALALWTETNSLSWDIALSLRTPGTRYLRVESADYPALVRLAPVRIAHRGLALSLLRALGHDPLRGRDRVRSRTILRHDLPMREVRDRLLTHGLHLVLLSEAGIQDVNTDAQIAALSTHARKPPGTGRTRARSRTASRLPRGTDPNNPGLLSLTTLFLTTGAGTLGVTTIGDRDPATTLSVTAQLRSWRGLIHTPFADLGLYRPVELDAYAASLPTKPGQEGFLPEPTAR